MIQSFSDSDAEQFFYTGKIKKRIPWSGCAKVAKRKLDMLDYAQRLEDLRSPPNNRLELLQGKLKGFYSIRVNAQFRVIFKWHSNEVYEVAIVDYHS